MNARKLRLISSSSPPEGKHIGDEMRSEILSRDWGRVLLWGDRQKALPPIFPRAYKWR